MCELQETQNHIRDREKQYKQILEQIAALARKKRDRILAEKAKSCKESMEKERSGELKQELVERTEQASPIYASFDAASVYHKYRLRNDGPAADVLE